MGRWLSLLYVFPGFWNIDVYLNNLWQHYSQDFSSPMSRDSNVTRDTVTRRDSHESVNRRASYASNRDKQVSRPFNGKFQPK